MARVFPPTATLAAGFCVRLSPASLGAHSEVLQGFPPHNGVPALTHKTTMNRHCPPPRTSTGGVLTAAAGQSSRPTADGGGWQKGRGEGGRSRKLVVRVVAVEVRRRGGSSDGGGGGRRPGCAAAGDGWGAGAAGSGWGHERAGPRHPSGHGCHPGRISTVQKFRVPTIHCTGTKRKCDAEVQASIAQ